MNLGNNNNNEHIRNNNYNPQALNKLGFVCKKSIRLFLYYSYLQLNNKKNEIKSTKRGYKIKIK